MAVGLVVNTFFPSIAHGLFSNPFSGQMTGFFIITLPVSLYFILFESSAWQALGSPPMAHWIIMAVAFGVEIILVNYVVFTITDRNSRRFWLWMLIVVGAHFLIFTFSHGPLAGLLGLLCIINALIGLRLKTIDYRVFWVMDGLLKIGIGTWMLLLTYSL